MIGTFCTLALTSSESMENPSQYNIIITEPHISLKAPGKIHFCDMRLCSYREDLSSYTTANYITGVSCHWHIFYYFLLYVFLSLCALESQDLSRCNDFIPCISMKCAILPRKFVNLMSDCFSHRVWGYIIPGNTLELKCMKSLLDELQTFSIRIWLDISAERLKQKVKCQLF